MTERAFIKATPAQLKSINIDDTYITNMLCDVTEIDQHTNSVGKCSRCKMQLHFNNTINEYIIPTDWLRILNKSGSTD